MANKSLEAIKKYVIDHCSSNSSDVLRKMSLFRGLSLAMSCNVKFKIDLGRKDHVKFILTKSFEFGAVNLKNIVIWQSSSFTQLERALDEFLNALRYKRAHAIGLEFSGDNGSCDIKLDIPYYETDDELQMQCALAGTWVDIEAA